MTHPVEILKNEHRIIEQVLRSLNGMCCQLESGTAVPPETLLQVVDFIRKFTDEFHHEKEETYLFPLLAKHGIPTANGPIGCMLHEHEVGRGCVAEMARAAEAYRKGEAQAGRQFADVARQYLNLLVFHIQKEDQVLFQMAENVLDRQEAAALYQNFQEVEEKFGLRCCEEYVQLAKKLEQTWATKPEKILF